MLSVSSTFELGGWGGWSSSFTRYLSKIYWNPQIWPTAREELEDRKARLLWRGKNLRSLAVKLSSQGPSAQCVQNVQLKENFFHMKCRRSPRRKTAECDVIGLTCGTDLSAWPGPRSCPRLSGKPSCGSGDPFPKPLPQSIRMDGRASGPIGSRMFLMKTETFHMKKQSPWIIVSSGKCQTLPEREIWGRRELQGSYKSVSCFTQPSHLMGSPVLFPLNHTVSHTYIFLSPHLWFAPISVNPFWPPLYWFITSFLQAYRSQKSLLLLPTRAFLWVFHNDRVVESKCWYIEMQPHIVTKERLEKEKMESKL